MVNLWYEKEAKKMSDKRIKDKILAELSSDKTNDIVNTVFDDETIKNEYYLNYSQNNILSIIAIAISVLSIIANVIIVALLNKLILNIVFVLVFVFIPYVFLLIAIIHDNNRISDRKKAFYFLKCQEAIEKFEESIKK